MTVKYENVNIFMPNEIFQDLTCIDKSTHRAFAYAYYYYTCYLYRYALFNQSDDSKITQKDIKQKLGYNPNEKRIDYIIKKGGVLDTIGYTQTTTDYPLMYVWDEGNEEPQFITINEYKSDLKANDSDVLINDRNYKIKFPVKAFFRTPEDNQNGNLNGTFYQIQNTHRIPYAVFEELMTCKELECAGFYFYAYLKMKCDAFQGNYKRSLYYIGEELGFSKATTNKYLKALEERSLLATDHKTFTKGGSDSNTYRV